MPQNSPWENKWSPWAHGERTVSSRWPRWSRLRGPMITAQSRLGEVTAQSRRGHISVTARSQLSHGEVTAQSQHLQYDHSSITAQVTAQSRMAVTILVTVSSRWAVTVANCFLMGGPGGYELCSPWRQCWFMCHWCKRNCLCQYIGTCSVPPQQQMYSFSVFLRDCRKNNHPFITKQLPTGWTCMKNYHCKLNRMHWKRIDSFSAGGYGLCLQWWKCWFEFHSCKGHCPPQPSNTCSVPLVEQMYLLSVFFTWLD